MGLSYAHPRYNWLPPATVGISAAATNSAITGSTFDVSGFDRMTLFVHFTRVAATGDIDITVEGYDETMSAWVTLQATETVTGVTTLTANTVRKATGSASQAYEVRFTEMCFRKVRIKVAIPTAAGATDLLSISALCAYFGG